ncbi:unnamed protein product, partial [Laminaria digitata]
MLYLCNRFVLSGSQPRSNTASSVGSVRSLGIAFVVERCASAQKPCPVHNSSKVVRVPVRPILSHFSFWSSRYSRVLSHFSFWYSRYSRVLRHFS